MALRDVIGQDRAVGMLASAMRLGRVASSYLFQGEPGIGKKFTALNFIKAINCLSPVKNEHGFEDACDICPSCAKLDAGTHPDFRLIEPDRGIIRIPYIRRSDKKELDSEGEEIRPLDEFFSFMPYEAKRKAVVMDGADAMNQEAANAFLKTLEEPPQSSLIILISSSADRLPETIRSRCSRVNFTPLGDAESGKVISRALGDVPQVKPLVRLTMGRPGLALGDDLLEKRGFFLETLKAILSGGIKSPWADRKDIEEWLEMAFMLLRDMMVFKIKAGRGFLINEDIKEEVGLMSKDADLKVIIDCYERLSLLRGYLAFNLNKAITWNYVSSLWREMRRG
jgi:DNA polymerase-3 subunit delta'